MEEIRSLDAVSMDKEIKERLHFASDIPIHFHTKDTHIFGYRYRISDLYSERSAISHFCENLRMFHIKNEITSFLVRAGTLVYCEDGFMIVSYLQCVNDIPGQVVEYADRLETGETMGI
jgi:hypothetical protein